MAHHLDTPSSNGGILTQSYREIRRTGRSLSAPPDFRWIFALRFATIACGRSDERARGAHRVETARPQVEGAAESLHPPPAGILREVGRCSKRAACRRVAHDLRPLGRIGGLLRSERPDRRYPLRRRVRSGPRCSAPRRALEPGSCQPARRRFRGHGPRLHAGSNPAFRRRPRLPQALPHSDIGPRQQRARVTEPRLRHRVGTLLGVESRLFRSQGTRGPGSSRQSHGVASAARPRRPVSRGSPGAARSGDVRRLSRGPRDHRRGVLPRRVEYARGATSKPCCTRGASSPWSASSTPCGRTSTATCSSLPALSTRTTPDRTSTHRIWRFWRASVPGAKRCTGRVGSTASGRTTSSTSRSS